jgi:hypothetical protein
MYTVTPVMDALSPVKNVTPKDLTLKDFALTKTYLHPTISG